VNTFWSRMMIDISDKQPRPDPALVTFSKNV